MTKELVKRVDDFTDSILMDAEDYGSCEGMSAQAILDEMGDILPDDIRDDLVAEVAWELKQIGKETWQCAFNGWIVCIKMTVLR